MMLTRIKSWIDRWLFDAEIEADEAEVRELLAEGKERESRSYERIAEAADDDEMRERAEQAAREQIRLTRVVNGMRGVRSYGRTEDE